MVPKLRNADKKDINSIAKELKKISDECRNLRIDKKDLFGGSMTISSLGGIGGTHFTPIINPPEVAILGVSRAKKVPFLEKDKVVEKTILPVALSYDHRVINGADAGKFMNFLKSEIEKGLE